MRSGRTEEYWEGVEEGKRHSSPSPATKRWMEKVDDDLKQIRDELKQLRESNIINSLSSKGFLAMIGLAVTAVFVALLNFVIK